MLGDLAKASGLTRSEVLRFAIEFAREHASLFLLWIDRRLKR